METLSGQGLLAAEQFGTTLQRGGVARGAEIQVNAAQSSGWRLFRTVCGGWRADCKGGQSLTGVSGGSFVSLVSV